MIRCAFALLFCLAAAMPGHALDLTLPAAARQTAGEKLGLDSYALPTDTFGAEGLPSRIFEGYVTRQAWRIGGTGVTPLQVLQPLRDQLQADGFATIFECEDTACGGFDFRFATDVIDPPAMLIDLGEFRFLSALKGPQEAPTDAISLLVSRNSETLYLQIIQVTLKAEADIFVDRGEALVGTRDGSTGKGAQTEQAAFETLPEIAKQLVTRGHVVLSDLDFATGSSDLGPGPFQSLADLASYLSEDARRRVALVGHTDNEGSLQGNIALSKRRARSVMARLQGTYGVAKAQLAAEGVGYLSPRSSNAKADGRETNRRVEAVLVASEDGG